MIIGFIPMKSYAMEGEYLPDGIRELQKYGAIKGTLLPDGTHDLKLFNALSRQEATLIICRLLDKNADNDINNTYVAPNEVVFSDVYNDYWKKVLKYAKAKGVANGIGGGKFAPTNSITAQQFLTMILRAVGYQDNIDFTYDNAYETGNEKKLGYGFLAPFKDVPLSRAVAFSYMYNAFIGNRKDGTTVKKFAGYGDEPSNDNQPTVITEPTIAYSIPKGFEQALYTRNGKERCFYIDKFSATPNSEWVNKNNYYIKPTNSTTYIKLSKYNEYPITMEADETTVKIIVGSGENKKNPPLYAISEGFLVRTFEKIPTTELKPNIKILNCQISPTIFKVRLSSDMDGCKEDAFIFVADNGELFKTRNVGGIKACNDMSGYTDTRVYELLKRGVGITIKWNPDHEYSYYDIKGNTEDKTSTAKCTELIIRKHVD